MSGSWSPKTLAVVPQLLSDVGQLFLYSDFGDCLNLKYNDNIMNTTMNAVLGLNSWGCNDDESISSKFSQLSFSPLALNTHTGHHCILVSSGPKQHYSGVQYMFCATLVQESWIWMKLMDPAGLTSNTTRKVSQLKLQAGSLSVQEKNDTRITM